MYVGLLRHFVFFLAMFIGVSRAAERYYSMSRILLKKKNRLFNFVTNNFTNNVTNNFFLYDIFK